MLAPSRRLALSFGLLLGLGALAGCNTQKATEEAKEVVVERAQPAPLTEPVVERPAAPVEASFLVWARDTVGDAKSYRLDDKGHILEELAGIHLGVDGHEWRWQEERIVQDDAVAKGCGDEDEGARADGDEGKSFVTRATIARTDESLSQLVVDPEIDEQEAGDFEHEVLLLRSVGSLLFVRQATHTYSCGAHGNLGASAFVWDISKSAEVDLQKELGKLAAVHKEAEKLLANDEDLLAADDEEVSLAELLPSFTPKGDLELRLRFTGFTCYACSDGEWSSYTSSVLLPSPRLPKALAAHAKTPEAVRAFIAHHPELELGGWSASHGITGRPGASMAP